MSKVKNITDLIENSNGIIDLKVKVIFDKKEEKPCATVYYESNSKNDLGERVLFEETFDSQLLKDNVIEGIKNLSPCIIAKVNEVRGAKRELRYRGSESNYIAIDYIDCIIYNMTGLKLER